jgi:hypothetical protein
VVAGEDLRTAQQQLAVVRDAHVAAGQDPADRAEAVLGDGVDR